MLLNKSDSELIREIRKGDATAFAQLFKSTCPALIRYAGRIVHSHQTAENVVQDVFVKIWHHRDRIEPGTNLKAYIYKAVKNQALQHLRHLQVIERSRHNSRINNPQDSPEQVMQDKQLAQAVTQAIGELPPHRRMIFTLSKYDHYTYAEIAEMQNISIKTVETQMGRALKFLRKRLAHLLSMVFL